MANKIVNRMNELSVTLDDLKKLSGLSIKRLRDIKDGDSADIREALDIADALDCNPDDIFVRQGEDWYFREKGGPF